MVDTDVLYSGFKIFKVSTDAPVSAFVERVLGISPVEHPEKYKGLKMTELIEGGDGVWHEVSLVFLLCQDGQRRSGSMLTCSTSRAPRSRSTAPKPVARLHRWAGREREARTRRRCG